MQNIFLTLLKRSGAGFHILGHFGITFGLFSESGSWCSSCHTKISLYLHVNETRFSERMSTRTHFQKEAKVNSDITQKRQVIAFFHDLSFAKRTEDIRNVIAYHVTSSLCARVALQTRYVKTK